MREQFKIRGQSSSKRLAAFDLLRPSLMATGMRWIMEEMYLLDLRGVVLEGEGIGEGGEEGGSMTEGTTGEMIDIGMTGGEMIGGTIGEMIGGRIDTAIDETTGGTIDEMNDLLLPLPHRQLQRTATMRPSSIEKPSLLVI